MTTASTSLSTDVTDELDRDDYDPSEVEYDACAVEVAKMERKSI